MSSNAAKEHSGMFDELKEKSKKIKRQIRTCLKEHATLDDRKAQLTQSVETLEKHFTKIDEFLKTASPRMGQTKKRKEVKSNITDNESAKMLTSKGTIQGYNGAAAVDKKYQIISEAQAYGEGQEHHTLKPMLDGINAYIPDNKFRSRDPKFKKQKEKYGKRHQDTKKGVKRVIPSNDFTFNLKKKTCVCPAGNELWLRTE